MARRSRTRNTRRNPQGQQNTAAPRDDGMVSLTFSSGYTATLRRLPFSTIKLMQRIERERFPEPEVPTKLVETELGQKKVPVEQNTPAGLEYLVKVQELAQARAAFRLDYIIDNYLTIDAEEKEGRNAIIQRHRAEIDLVKALDPDLDDWTVFVRHVAIQNATDYQVLQKNAVAFSTPVTDEEIKSAAASFRGDVQRQSDPGDQASGA